MHRTAWILQIVLGAYFLTVGVLHFVVPDGLPELIAWMYDLPTWAHVASGAAEILGGLGLVLPGLARIRTELTPVAAGGLALVMLFAAGWHISRGELASIAGNVVVLVLLLIVAEVRWRRHPLPAR